MRVPRRIGLPPAAPVREVEAYTPTATFWKTPVKDLAVGDIITYASSPQEILWQVTNIRGASFGLIGFHLLKLTPDDKPNAQVQKRNFDELDSVFRLSIKKVVNAPPKGRKKGKNEELVMPKGMAEWDEGDDGKAVNDVLDDALAAIEAAGVIGPLEVGGIPLDGDNEPIFPEDWSYQRRRRWFVQFGNVSGFAASDRATNSMNNQDDDPPDDDVYDPSLHPFQVGPVYSRAGRFEFPPEWTNRQRQAWWQGWQRARKPKVPDGPDDPPDDDDEWT